MLATVRFDPTKYLFVEMNLTSSMQSDGVRCGLYCEYTVDTNRKDLKICFVKIVSVVVRYCLQCVCKVVSILECKELFSNGNCVVQS